MEKLSDDVLTNIFIRLPARQLAQMRCISKPWNAILSESYLINCHLNHSICNNKDNEIFLVFVNLGLHQQAGHVLPYNLSGSPIMELSDLVKLPDNFPHGQIFFSGAHVIGSINGLICFYIGYSYYVKGIYIWNPSLSVVMALPRLPEPLFGPYDFNYRFSFGFGFDPKTDDYKVVKLLRNCDKLIWLHVEVYSMKKGCWELIADSFPPDVDEGADMFIDDHNGHLHWLCNKVYVQTIVAFDLGVDSFSQISLPDSVANDKDNRHNSLGVLDGKLCVVSNTICDGELEVWVMNEYGVAESWVKSHVLSKLKGDITPFGFTLNNKFLFYDNSKRFSALYDQETDRVVTRFESYGIYCLREFVEYVDSLVWYVAPTN